jgi:hypothetical protein
MNHVRFCMYQFILFSSLYVINLYLDKFISKPFTYVDFIAICISVPIIIIGYTVVNNLYRRFENIRLQNKILTSIPTAIIAILFIGYLEQLFF